MTPSEIEPNTPPSAPVVLADIVIKMKGESNISISLSTSNGHGCPSLVSVVCCQVEGSASG